MIVIGVQTKRRDITISVQYRLTIGIVFARNERKDGKKKAQRERLKYKAMNLTKSSFF